MTDSLVQGIFMKNTTNARFKTLAAIGFATLLLAGTSLAIPLSAGSSIDITANGSHVVINMQNNTVDFVDDYPLVPGNARVSNATGDLAGFVFQSVMYNNFSYDPLTVENPIWSLTTGLASFDLLSINSIVESSAGLILTGSGVLHASGFDSTPGDWSFSANSTRTYFTFSNQTTANAVPDGGSTVLLLGVAIIGLGILSRCHHRQVAQ